MSDARDLHHRAMELFESALLARRGGEESRTRRLLSEALQLESSAAEALAEDYSV